MNGPVANKIIISARTSGKQMDKKGEEKWVTLDKAESKGLKVMNLSSKKNEIKRTLIPNCSQSKLNYSESVKL